MSTRGQRRALLASSAVAVAGRAVSVEESRGAAANRDSAPASRAGHLFHPAADFLLVGGASLVLLPPAWLLGEAEREAVVGALGSLAIVLVTLVNYPHFAHSYQLLYEGFAARVFGRGVSRIRRLRTVWAGIVAPLAVATLLVVAGERGGLRGLGYAANAMGFLVGWHYVKQGYGILLVLSARAGAPFDASERNWLWRNGIAVWIYSWTALNRGVHESVLLGIPVRTLDLPAPLIDACGVSALATTAVVGALLLRRVARRRLAVSVNGLAGYVAALYLWVVARYTDPVFALLVPVFHSLQYLPFVWRRRLDADARPARTHAIGTRATAVRPLAVFVVSGAALGWLGFVGVPALLQETFAPEPARFGPDAFAFLFFVWINVHHYFIDNVIWRGDEETVRRLLRGG